jgi:chorismate-pyruvate lyase
MAVDTRLSQLGELVRRHFVLQDERPGGIEEVEIGMLDPFLRSLLFTDGTVTRALAVETLTPVSVSPLSQEEVVVPAEIAAYLETETGATSIRRRVEIGSGSTPMLWAESHLLPDRLPPGFFGRLENAADGIGQSLQRLENYRELLWFGVDASPDWASSTAGDASIRRLYRLVSERQPAILISESFLVERHSDAYRLAGLVPPAGAGRSAGGASR